MKIAFCASMTASKKMVELEKILVEKGHEVTLPDFTIDYAKLDTIDKMHTESARNKVDYDLIRGYFKIIKKQDAILVVNEKRHGIENYIGGNTLIEMSFAYVLEKEIFVYNSLPKIQYSDEIEAMQPIVLNKNVDLIK